LSLSEPHFRGGSRLVSRIYRHLTANFSYPRHLIVATLTKAGRLSSRPAGLWRQQGGSAMKKIAIAAALLMATAVASQAAPAAKSP
jgi:hypothetical protein